MSSSSDSSYPASLIQPILSRVTGSTGVNLPVLYPVEGGSINAAYRITTKNNAQWFSKINDSTAFPDLLEKESRGLDFLRMRSIFRIPAVVACETARGTQILLLEWINQGPATTAFWHLFGEQLARLHRVSAEFPSATLVESVSPAFGLSWNNYMGALPQSNTPSLQWVDFFIQQRLDPQLRLAAEKGLLAPAALRSFERLYKVLPDIFGEEAPSLLHGDLWSGNFLCDDKSRPVLIDPAVYLGHRSIDLAMTTLFGGFDPAFYQAYTYHFPFPVNYQEQWEICNLYPLLIHLNLFGEIPGKGALPKDGPFPDSIDVGPSAKASVTPFSYAGSILNTIQRF